MPAGLRAARRRAIISADSQMLNPYGINIRYPVEAATIEDAKEALLCLRRIRELVRRKRGAV